MVLFSFSELLILFLVILLIGILANIAGFGGAILVIPLLHIVFQYPLKIVIGSSLSAIAIPAFIGFLSSWRRGEVDFTAGFALEIPTIAGVAIGAALVRYVDDVVITIIFGSIALVVSMFMMKKTVESRNKLGNEMQSQIWKKLTKLHPWYVVEKENYSYRLSIPMMIVSGIVIGILSGLLGVGGGWLKTPLLIFGIGLPPIIASGTALFMLTITAIVGGFLHLQSGYWDLNLFLAIGTSLSIGAVLGDKIKQKINGYYISITISLSLALVALLLLIQSILSI